MPSVWNSKKFVIWCLSALGNAALLGLMAASNKHGWGLPGPALIGAIGGLNVSTVALITGQSYADAKTGGATSGTVQAANAAEALAKAALEGAAGALDTPSTDPAAGPPPAPKLVPDAPAPLPLAPPPAA